MAFQFPPSPSVNQTFTPVAGVTYRWSGTAWHLIAGPGAFLTAADADVRYVNIDEAQNTTNRIINGKMAIDQRNAGATVTVPAGATIMGIDRWVGGNYMTIGVFQMTRQLLDSSRLNVSVTTTGTLAAGNLAIVSQYIEGLNISDFGFGTPAASPITLAFDIAVSNPGTYSVSIANNAADRSYVAPFTVASAGSYETKVLTIPGATAGVWATDNTGGAAVRFSLGGGTNFIAPAGNVWTAGNFTNVAGNLNVMGISGGYIILRNVRLYKGSVDFGPDRRLYAEELALCQRYYQKSYDIGTVPGTFPVAGGSMVVNPVLAAAGATFVNIKLTPPMRDVPSVVFYNPETGATGTWRQLGAGEIAILRSNAGSSQFHAQTNSTVAVGPAIYGHFTASAEL